MISLLIATKDGNVVEAGTIGRGGAFGLQSALGERRSYTRTTIQIPGVFTTISAVDFRRAASNISQLIVQQSSQPGGLSWAGASRSRCSWRVVLPPPFVAVVSSRACIFEKLHNHCTPPGKSHQRAS